MQVSDRVTDMFADPIEEVILEVLLHLQVSHPPRALKMDLILGSFQPHGLFIVTLDDLIEVLHENVKGSHCAKNN